MTVKATWNLEVAQHAAVACALDRPFIVFLRRFSLWFTFAAVCFLLLALNWPLNSRLHIGGRDLSAYSNGAILIMLLCAAYVFSIWLRKLMGSCWREGIRARVKPWLETADGTIAYTISNEGLRIESALSAHDFVWKAISDVKTKEDFILIYGCRQILTLIPTSAFESKDQLNQFVRESLSHIANNG